MELSPPALPMESERLLLRDYRWEDWEAVWRYNANEDFWRFIPIPPQTEETTKDFIAQVIEQQHQNPRVHYSLAVVEKAGTRLVGGVRLSITSEHHREGSLGYAFDPAVWGQGYATEAVGRVLVEGFRHIGLHRIHAVCDPENRGSARVMEKLGMTREGCLRSNLLLRGQWRDSLIYSILEQEFR